MKKLFLGTIFLVMSIAVPVPAMAGLDISIGISLPPLVRFAEPPDVIVMPYTDDAYVVPGISFDLFFWRGWWWRPWEGCWYRSQHYDRGWAYYNKVPSFYYDVDARWRRHYRDRNWYGHHWGYERIPYYMLQHNWKSWHNKRYWEKQRAWGVKRYQPQPHRNGPRQDQYQQRHDSHRYYQHRPESYGQQRQQIDPHLKRPPKQVHSERLSSPWKRSRADFEKRHQAEPQERK